MVTMHMICPICGSTFEASTWGARYCSGRCRQAAARERRKILDALPDIPPAAFDLNDAVSRLKYVASDFAAIGACSAPPVRTVCLRFSSGIADLLDAEGML